MFANINGQNVRSELRQLQGEFWWSTVAGNVAVRRGTPKLRHPHQTSAELLNAAAAGVAAGDGAEYS